MTQRSPQESSNDEPPASHDAELRAMFGESGGGLGEGGPDAEMQRALVAARLFGGPPVAIGRFLVEKVLGAGASAVVYAARDPLLDRRVALKVMARPPPDRRQAVLSRVIREARAAAQLSHGNLVSIYEVGEWDGRPFIAMELIEGSTLAQWLVDEARALPAICEVFLQAGRGLAAAHVQGRVHRDFKPANVLVAHHGRVVVSDFGLAGDIRAARAPLANGTCEMETLSEEEAAGPVLGTPAYAAPEQRGGVAAHPSADVYSFAISLVEALLGYHPSAHSSTALDPSGSAPSLAELRAAAASTSAAAAPSAILSSPARPAWQLALRPRLPRQLFVELCAAAQPELWRRSQTLGPLLEALRACAPASKRQRRGVYLVGASALVLGVALAAAIGMSLSQCGRRGPGFSWGADPEPRPAVLAEKRRALLAVPESLRSEAWRQAASGLLLLPIATEVPCQWPEKIVSQAILEGSVIALDARRDVYACDLRSAVMTKLASDVRCLRDDGYRAVELAFLGGGSEVHYLEGRSWRRELGPPRASSKDQQRGELPILATSGQCLSVSPYVAGTHLRVRSYQYPSYPEAISDGTRRAWLEGGDLYFRPAAGAAAQLLVRQARQFHFDDALSVAVAVSPLLVAIDLASGTRAEVPLPQPSEPRSSLVFEMARDGSMAVASMKDGPLWWWRRGERVWHEIPIAPEMVSGLAVGPQGRLVVVFDSGRLQVIELMSGRRYLLADSQIRKARIEGSDQVVATDVSGRTWRWSLAAQRSVILAEHPGNGIMWGLAVSADSSVVASSSGGKDASMVHVASLGEGAARAAPWVLPMPPGVGVHGLTFDGDRLLAGTSDSVLRSWNWRSKTALAQVKLPVARWVWSLAVAHLADGAPVDVVGMGQLTRNSEGSVLLVRGGVASSVFASGRGANTGIDEVSISGDERLAVAGASSGQIAVIDVASGAVAAQQAHAGEVRNARAFGADRAITTGDDGVARVWRIAPSEAGQAPKIEALQSILVARGKIFELALHEGSALLGSADGDLGFFDLDSGARLRSYAGHSTAITALDIDRRGRWLVSGDERGKLCLQALQSVACGTSLIGHKADLAIRNARFLPDGRLLTSSDDRTVRLWSPLYDASGEALARELARFTFLPER